MNANEQTQNNRNGLCIPYDLAADQSLSWAEKALYSIYHYFTFYGAMHCCRYTNEAIAERVGFKKRWLQVIKKSLTDKGLIKVSGIAVTALKRFEGMQDYAPISDNTEGVHDCASRGAEVCTHNKNKKDIEISSVGVYTLSEGTNIAPENDFDMFDFLADATDTGEADTYTNDETEQYAYQMAQETINTTPTETTATPTPTPKPNKKRYWESWKAFKVAMPTLPKDKAKEHFDTYYTKLGVLYTGDELAKHRQGITEDYERIMNKANNNNSNYTNGSKFQLPDDMRIDIMPLRAMGYTNREILATYSQMAGENIRLADELPNRKNYVPQYVRYYFNEMRQIIASMISDGYTDADLTDIAKSYWVDSVLERYQPENFK